MLQTPSLSCNIELKPYGQMYDHTQGTHSGCRVQHGSAPMLGLHSAGPHGLCAAVKETPCGGGLITTTRPENDREKDARLSKGCVLIFQSGSYLIHLLSV